MKILVVDDSDVILSSLKSFFEDYNFEVETSQNGLDGLKMAAEFKPDLVFLDLMMPNFDGLKMLQVMKVLHDLKNIPVIVISANTARRNVLAATEAGADRVISKPLRKEVLVKVVNEVMGETISVKAESISGVSGEEQNEIKSGLVKIFLNSYPAKKQAIQSSIRTKNILMLKTIMHEIKGAGGTMGYQKLSDLAHEVHEREINSPTDWVFIEFKCNEIFQEILKMDRELNLKQ